MGRGKGDWGSFLIVTHYLSGENCVHVPYTAASVRQELSLPVLCGDGGKKTVCEIARWRVAPF